MIEVPSQNTEDSASQNNRNETLGVHGAVGGYVDGNQMGGLQADELMVLHHRLDVIERGLMDFRSMGCC